MNKIVYILLLILTTVHVVAQQDNSGIFEITYLHPDPVLGRESPEVKDNKYGFEGGKVFKSDGKYILFITELHDDPFWAATRLAAWISSDGLNWTRVGTISSSGGQLTPDDPKASIWSPVPVYDKKNGRWSLTYISFYSDVSIQGQWKRKYDGRVYRMTAMVPGQGGLFGPYGYEEVLMEYGQQPASWETWMGVTSFCPYPVDGKWLALYGSSWEVAGLATATAISDLWVRVPSAEPLFENMENPVITRLKNGLYVAVFDGASKYQKMGYMFSEDGVQWSRKYFFGLEANENKWWELSRTPLGLIDEGDRGFTLYFTAYNKNFYEFDENVWIEEAPDSLKGMFGSVGMMKLKLKEDEEHKH